MGVSWFGLRFAVVWGFLICGLGGSLAAALFA